MQPKILLPMVALVVLAVAGVRAETYEDIDTGYKLPIPTGWKHRYDPGASALTLAGPGGIRVRIAAKDAAAPMEATLVQASYRRDGERLKEKYGGVKVLAKPAPTGAIGSQPAQGYGFLCRAGVDQMLETRGWLASGPSESAGKSLHVKVLAYGSREAMVAGEASIKALIAGFGWPVPPEQEKQEEPRPAKEVLAAIDLPPPPAAELAAPTELLRAAAGKIPSKLLAAAAAELSGNKAFDRGSLSGGVGFMGEAGVCKDPAAAKALVDAFRIEDRSGVRSEEEQERAAAYLGFGSKPEAPALPIPAVAADSRADEGGAEE